MKIAVSGKSGCGNTTISRLVSEKLELSFINFTFRSLIAVRLLWRKKRKAVFLVPVLPFGCLKMRI